MEEFFLKLADISKKTNGGLYINQLNIVLENKGTVNNRNSEVARKDRHAHFPPCIEVNRGVALHRLLIEKGMIGGDSDEASFLYLIGCTDEPPESVEPIEWFSTKQLLREMLEGMAKPLLEGEKFKKADIERLAPLCFRQDGKPLRLAKPKPVPSQESDALTNFFST